MVRANLPPSLGWDVKILATDIDSNVLLQGENGVYSEERINNLPSDQVRKWFRKGRCKQEGMVRVDPSLQEIIRFKQLNLMNPWPMKGPFDAIFCRNVLIYFDKDTKMRLLDRYADILSDKGYLFIGHSESLYQLTNRFHPVGNTIYRKVY